VAQSINTNVAALSAQRYLNRNQADLTTAMNRLSSGLRINSARDDAAGMTLAERMTTQIRGLNVASRNANDAIALAQTAEAAMGSVASALQRIRELAVQSANASYSDTDRSTMNREARELIEEIKRVSTNTAFNGVNLLDGSFQDQQFQIGANSGQTLNLPALADARVTSLGRSAISLNGVTGSLLGEAGAAGATAAAGSNGMDAATNLVFTNPEGSSSPITWAAGASAKEIAAAINLKANSLGITATATNSATIGGFSATGAMSLVLNGTTVNATLASTSDLTPLADAINGAATGVTAVFANPPAKDQLKLTAADGSDIRIENLTNATAAMTMDVTGSKTGATAVTLDANVTTPAAASTTDSTIIPGTLEVESSKGALKWSGGVVDAFGTGNVSGIAGLNTISTVDLGSMTGAVSAIKVVDAALDQLSSARGTLGAVQSRLEMLIANVDVVSENITTARGRLVDADFAKETAALARVQILQQAGTAMLAQANALPQQVLQLLKG
jgi:flagellin